MNFCSNCGSADIVFTVPKGDNHKRFVCRNCGRIFYENPRVIVGCLARHHDSILMCKRAIEPQAGLWNLPAGFLENGEKAEDGAARETLEESGAKVEIVRLHAVFSLPIVNQVYLHFLAEINNIQELHPTKESLEVQLFAPDKIPWNNIAFQSTTFALKKYLENPADFQGVHIGSLNKKEKWTV